MIQNDRHISIRVISAGLNLSYEKNCTRWFPRLLTKEIKGKRLNACKELLERYEIEGEGFIDRIMTGDESWIHHHIPDSKRSSARMASQGPFYNPIWNDDNCNAYNGSDGTVFPPHLTKEDDVYVFSQDVCRYCTIT
ncbi:hypothetical protein LAZ67_10000082 [Cordylochernes scorpioides]|uniref:Mariner Mos1 transposase n=1 Tax=Cordylochernes scorpioides TaxID=51811 RepID=A0ABY6KYJ0_9ARAC|nr:hypothetical protein LAZ67_10000082 [Cordylochernes scorpioides]